MKADASRGGHLGKNVSILQKHRVVTGPSSLVFMTEGRRVSRLRLAVDQRFERNGAHGRHEKDVAIIRNAGAAQMCVAESVNDSVGIVITRTAVPTGEARIRTELHHAEGKRSAGKSMAVARSADEWIDIASRTLLSRSQDRK